MMLGWFFGKRTARLCLVAVLLGACGTADEDLAYIEKSDHQLYNEAMDEMYSRNYRRASKLFDEIERQHPYSNWATKGQIMAAFCRYKINDYDEAVIGLDRFIELHPSNPDVPYAQYLKGLSYYEQVRDVSRDQRNSELALNAFQELIRRFPGSTYAGDADKKTNVLIDHLAGKEMEVGRYYQKREHYLAAINRYRNVVEEYDTTFHVTEALHRLTESYISLGMALEARKTAAVLGYNYPQSEWYQDTYALLENNGLLQSHDNDKYRLARRATFDEEGYIEHRGGKKDFFGRAWGWIWEEAPASNGPDMAETPEDADKKAADGENSSNGENAAEDGDGEGFLSRTWDWIWEDEPESNPASSPDLNSPEATNLPNSPDNAEMSDAEMR